MNQTESTKQLQDKRYDILQQYRLVEELANTGPKRKHVSELNRANLMYNEYIQAVYDHNKKYGDNLNPVL